MRQLLNDKWMVRYAAAAQVVWLACIVMMWAWAFDASGEAMLLTLTAMLLAVAAAAAMARPLARAARWGLVQAGGSPGETLTAVLGEDGAGDGIDGRRLMRLFSAASFAAVVGSLGSMAAVFLSMKLTDVLSRHFFWTPMAWAVLKLAVQWAGMLPAAAGALAMLAAGALIRRDGAAGPTATIFRLWMAAIAAGVAFFAAAWWLGASLPALAMAMGGVMLATAVRSWWGGRATPAMADCPGGRADRDAGGGRKVLATFAVGTLALTIQLRLLGEMFGVSMVGRWLWTAVSLLLLVRLIRRADRRAAKAWPNESIGAAIGVVAGVGGQMAMAAVALADRRLVWFGALSWLFLQAPLLAIAARAISQQRQAWPGGEASNQRYISAVTLGCGIGFAAYLLSGLGPLGWLVPSLALALSLGGAIVGARRAGRLVTGMQWVICGVIMAAATAMAVASPMHQLGSASRGVWLSLLGEGAPSARFWRADGSLPYARTWRSDQVTAAMNEVLQGADDLHARRGRWWVIATSHRDEPSIPGVYVASSVPDPTALPSSARRSFLLLGSEGNYLAAAQIGNGMFDGLLLAPLPADHPEAWRCYNERTIRRCVRRVHPNGAILLRTQASQGHIDDLMAVAATFTRVVGPSWAVVEFHDGMIDLLLAGPREIDGQDLIARPTDRAPTVVFPSERFQDDRMHIRPVRVLHPRGPRRGRALSANRLRYHLRSVSGGQ